EELPFARRVRETRGRGEESRCRIDRAFRRKHGGDAEMHAIPREGEAMTNVRAIYGCGDGHGDPRGNLGAVGCDQPIEGVTGILVALVLAAQRNDAVAGENDGQELESVL